MNDKSLREELLNLGLFLGAMLLGALLGVLLNAALAQVLDLATVKTRLLANPQTAPATDRNALRIILAINHLCMFVLPVIVFGWLRRRLGIGQPLAMRLPRRIEHFLYSVLGILVAFPAVLAVYALNKQIPLPPALAGVSNTAESLTAAFLVMPTAWEAMLNLVVIAAIPALGEELVFRGVLQPLVGRVTQRTHLAVWATALVFSAMHFQFEGLLPRFLLGAMLGYMALWSGSLWTAVLAHAVFNGSQVWLKYQMPTQAAVEAADAITQSTPSAVGIAVSVGLCAVVGYQFYQSRQVATPATLSQSFDQ